MVWLRLWLKSDIIQKQKRSDFHLTAVGIILNRNKSPPDDEYGSAGQTHGSSSSKFVHHTNLSWKPVNPSVHQMSPSTLRVYSELHQLFTNVAHFLYLLKAAVVLDELPSFSWTFAEDHSARRHSVSSLNHRCLHLESVEQISSLFFCEWVKWHDTRSSWVYWGHGHNNHSHIPRQRHQFVLDPKIPLIPFDTSMYMNHNYY